MICDPKEREASRERGDDPDRLPAHYARMTNEALAGRPGRHGRHHAFLPRQFPLHLHRPGRLRAGGGAAARRGRRSTAISSNTTAPAPAASSRCGSSPRARSRSCSGWSPPRAGRSKTRTTIKRRIDEATKYVALDQLCLSAAMRLCLDRGRQYPGRGRAMGEAAHDRRARRRSLGQILIGARSPIEPRDRQESPRQRQEQQLTGGRT